MASTPHLLLVDDDADIFALLTNFFRKHSHIVSTATNSAEMFAILKNQPIDLVIADCVFAFTMRAPWNQPAGSPRVWKRAKSDSGRGRGAAKDEE